MKFLTIIILGLAVLSGSSYAQLSDFDFSKPATKASLISDSTTITPGQNFQVALKLTHPDDWHSYYKNDGMGIANAPEIAWTLPEGFSASDLVYPAPHEIASPGKNTYAYTGSNYFLTTITAPDDLKPNSQFEIEAAASWQICKVKCVSETKQLALDIDVSSKARINPEFISLAEYSMQKIPSVELPSEWKIKARESGGKIELLIEGDLPDTLHFYEVDRQIDVQQPRSSEPNEDGSRLVGQRNQGNLFSKKFPSTLGRLRGVLASDGVFPGTDRQAFWIDVPLEQQAGNLVIAPDDNGKIGVVMVFIFLFIGGLILNLMPCVFPVVGLKIMGFVNQAGKEKSKIKLHGMSFTSGVLLSFLALATFLYPIKSEKSLGAQMAEPWVVFALIIVFLLLALSMSGVFEIGTRATAVGGKLAHRDGLAGSFLSGVLAVVVATPCSAPFLGPAIGAAWKFDGALFFMALLTMGVGLSLPYILLSFFPALVSKLPRPGAWMESFKQGMAFLLYAAVGYLIWVYNGQVNDDGQKELAIMLGITAMAFAVWIYGRWCPPARRKGVRMAGFCASALAFLLGLFLAKPAGSESDGTPPLEWGKWSPEKVEELVAAGQPVYVDFTARWCPTCQSNKATAYTAEVRQQFHDKGIVTLKADKSVANLAADQAIQELGRAAIPVNVLYAPETGTPHITRVVLTAGYLKELVAERLDENH